MSVRPQFPYPTPEGYQDEEFTQYFDEHNVPGLGASLAAGQSILGVPLPLEQGILYHIRGIEVATEPENPLAVRFQDPYGNYLSDDFVPVGTYNGGEGNEPGGTPTVCESEIVCPPGGIMTVDIKNQS